MAELVTTDIVSTCDVLRDLSDPRIAVNRRHLLGDLIENCVSDVTARADGTKAIGKWRILISTGCGNTLRCRMAFRPTMEKHYGDRMTHKKQPGPGLSCECLVGTEWHKLGATGDRKKSNETKVIPNRLDDTGDWSSYLI